MNETKSARLVLVADDDAEFREDLLPKELERRLSLRTVRAENVYEALQIAMRKEDQPDLIVLDMHMPLDDDNLQVAADGGVQFLHACALGGRPVVVFTAYPGYQNCVAAVQAGAAAYLPKMPQDTYEGNQEGGIDHLVEVCRQLLEGAPRS